VAKIVFVIEQLYGGGAERVTAALMNELCKESEVHLITTYDYDTENDFPTDERIIKHRFMAKAANRAIKFLKRIIFLRRKISEIDPDCVVSLAGCGTNSLLTTALIGKKYPLILSERNDPARFPRTKIERILRYISYVLCEGLVFQTHEAQSFFGKRICRKSIIICNPVSGNLPPRYEGERERRIVNYCRLNPQKNLELLIDAFADIAAEFPEHTLEIYGDGPERARLENRIAELKLSGRAFLHGYSDNIFEEILKASVFVSSSDYEGISNSMLEAGALGVPAICTACPAGSAREVIKNGVNGILVPTGDRAAMADAMRSLLGDPDMMERISRHGCRLRDEISAAAIAGKWKKYIDEICSGQSL